MSSDHIAFEFLCARPDPRLRVRVGHMILEGAVTVEWLDRLAAQCQAEARALRRARHADTQPTHYETLGVPRDATPEEIQAAYRRLAKQHHPDVANGENPAAMQRLNQAYAVLGDPQRRQQYDATP